MRTVTSRKPVQTDGAGLARTRVRFLTGEPVEPNEVRETILASWWRSRRSNVAADRVVMPYVRDPNLDTPLTRSAEPVLRHLHQQLAGQPISVVLTDHAGLVLQRLTGDAQLERHLDFVHLATGFSCAEEFVGTNGIGTALEGGRPMHVFGHEHYAESLEDLACAGVPINHPISGKTIGAVDLTCWRGDAGPLLMTLAKTTAEQIRQALLTDSATQEIELLREYLRVCRRILGIVFAISNDIVMLNDYAQTVIVPADQAALLRQASEALAQGERSKTLDLPSGMTVKMYARPVGSGPLAGGVVHAKVVQASAVTIRGTGTPARMLLPGLVGSGALWCRACDDIDGAYLAREWLAVEGEPGVGKLAILRAVHQRRNPGARFTVLDAADTADQGWLGTARRVLLGEDGGDTAGSVVLHHVDRLSGVQARSLAADLQAARDADGERADGWVAVTLHPGPPTNEIARLLRLFPRTVDVPPLRHHIEDIGVLAPFFVARLGYGGALTCPPDVLQVLMRFNWPDNIEQLLQTMRRVVQHRRTGAIRPRDLPAGTRAVSRRLLNPLESIERDAIAASLQDAEGNKARAAKSLGMSRATIYRKIHEYGIVPPTG